MLVKNVTRRRFVGGMAAALGYVSLKPETALGQAGGAVQPARGAGQGRGGGRGPVTPEQYDSFAKLANNENNWGPPDSVMKAMNSAWKYSNRYGYPGGDIQNALAEHHGVKPENILMGAGSGEILQVVGTTFGLGGRKVVGSDPSYGSVYQHATSIKSEAIKVPLNADYSQNIPALIEATNKNVTDVGFVYLCNPNNPTGMIVPSADVKRLMDNIPKDMPVLIDEAYHHFVDDPRYATSINYVLEGRPVIVARTFSKIAALAAMRLGYAVAPAEVIQKMRPFATGSQNVLVRFGGLASLKDTAGQADVKAKTIAQRKKTTAELNSYGYSTIPSEANFFMVHLGREVQPVIQEFREKGVLVGRPFPPMTQHLRVSIGLPEEMDRFMKAFKEIFPQKTSTSVAR
jgi:histidinol-phosphate aminotransferase